ncbi:MAG: hypothetical protein KC561_15870, partial [Myxococcales bacterium]|nr:hypothetical protein [Myxococcales bacterium]
MSERLISLATLAATLLALGCSGDELELGPSPDASDTSADATVDSTPRDGSADGVSPDASHDLGASSDATALDDTGSDGMNVGTDSSEGEVAPSLGVLFVTQVPVPFDFTTITSVFGNHQASLSDVYRGGHLMLRYHDGTTRNLTAEAGFGASEANLIAVRDPCVHWDGRR